MSNGLRCGVPRRAYERASIFGFVVQQRLHFLAKGIVAGAGLTQKSGARAGGKLGSLMEYCFNPLTAGFARGCRSVLLYAAARQESAQPRFPETQVTLH